MATDMATPVIPLIDCDSAALIAQLQKEDAESFISQCKGKQKEGDLTDAEIAMQTCLEELNLFQEMINDHLMAQSMAEAVIVDGPVLREMSEQDVYIQRDYELALQLQRNPEQELDDLTPANGNATMPDADEEELDDESLTKLHARHFAQMVGKQRKPVQTGPQVESSKWAATREPPGGTDSVQCTACTNLKPWHDTVHAPCGDSYCDGCVSELFELAMKDESLYPPRCCRQNIPLKSVRIFLKPGQYEAFKKKSIELDTKNRTYCFAPTCNTFIPTSSIREDIATCLECSRTTCTICRGPAHRGDCPEDTALQQVLQTAESVGWQRCYQCHALVELETGCNHMS